MIALLSDIHSNLAALEAVLDASHALGCTRIISLGDIVGYHAEPGQCIDVLREHNATNIMGNHDYYLVSGTGCPRSKLVSELTEFQRPLVTREQLAWLADSIPYLVEDGNYFAHGGWKDVQDQYLYRVEASDIPPGAANFFTGHTHVQVLFDFDGRRYCNPGSVGQPRDGDPRAAFATLSGDRIELHRVAYDIERTVAQMKKTPFPPKCYENLYLGAQIGGRIDKVVMISDREDA
jgi:predicted phosphodiesterase